MIAFPFILLLMFGAPQQPTPGGDSDPQQNVEQAKANYKAQLQAAIHINDLAGNIHSEADARAFVDAIAARFPEDRYQFWMTAAIRQRVAQAEYHAVSDSAHLIPEARIVEVWNEYVREIDAPEETLVTVAEVHNLRDAMYTHSRMMWQRSEFPQSLWTMPAIYAVGADGKVANGARAVEAVKIVYDMYRFFQSVQSARDRVKKGVWLSDKLVPQQDAAPRPQAAKGQVWGSRPENPVRTAEYRYIQAHGDGDYLRLLGRLYGQLFPAD